MKYGAIAAGDRSTLESALEILKSGGNAFDAAVGAVFTSMTSEFALTSAGGGGSLLAFPNNSEPILFDFFVNALPPNKKSLDFFPVSVDFGSTKQIFNIGKGSIAVPGNIAGLLHVQNRLGVLSLKAVLEPAISIAKTGIIINKTQEFLIKILEPILTFDSCGKSIFKPQGSLVRLGERIIFPKFAEFLTRLSVGGADFFYKDEGADLLVSLANNGGLLTKKHLENYQVIERKPLKSKLFGYTLYTNPAPSIGGTLIAFLLQIINKEFCHENINHTALTHLMYIAKEAKKEIYTNPSNEHQITKMLDTEIVSEYINHFKNNKILSQNSVEKAKFGSTTHLSILDKKGNAASVTTTNGEGCGYFVPALGFMMNNMLGEEALNPAGFHLWTKEQRLPTLISPTIVVGDSGPELILGSGGSNRIASAISQVIINTLLHKMDLYSAISSPRIHLEGNTLHHEPGIILNDKTLIKKSIEKNTWDKMNLFFGGVNAVSKHAAVGDPRRDGVGGIF